MNPMLKKLLAQVDSSIDLVEEVMHHQDGQMHHLEAQHDKLRKQHWSQTKELNLLQEQAAHITAVQEENERFQDIQRELRERLERILTHTKALGEGLRQ